MSRTATLIILAIFVAFGFFLFYGLPTGTRDATVTGPFADSNASSGPAVNANALADAKARTNAFPKSGSAPGETDQGCDEDMPMSLAEIMSSAEFEAWMQEFVSRNQGTTDGLAVSPEAEHLYVAALRERDEPMRLRLLEQALESNPDSAVALWSALQLCFRMDLNLACPLDDWESRLLLIDSHNSEAWMVAAVIRYESGNTNTALEALRQAATAPETRVYWPEMLEMTERSLSAVGNYTFAERVAMAFDTAAANQPSYGRYTNMCKTQSAIDAEWASLCLAYGERAERQAKTLLGASISRAIQSIALEAMGEVQKRAEVNKRREQIRLERLAEAKSGKANMTYLMWTSPTLFSAYITAVKTVGEAEAADYVVKEARRTLGYPQAPDCN